MHPCYPPKPNRPPRPEPPQGYLVQRIIACEKCRCPCQCAEWCFDSCSGSIQQISACGTPCWTLDGCTLHATIPVSVTLRDACGHVFTRSAAAEAETVLPRSFVCSLDDPGNTLLILPCVNLIRAECACGGCFRVQMGIAMDLYLLRYETLRCGSAQPRCPQLPLYPPPVC